MTVYIFRPWFIDFKELSLRCVLKCHLDTGKIIRQGIVYLGTMTPRYNVYDTRHVNLHQPLSITNNIRFLIYNSLEFLKNTFA